MMNPSHASSHDEDDEKPAEGQEGPAAPVEGRRSGQAPTDDDEETAPKDGPFLDDEALDDEEPDDEEPDDEELDDELFSREIEEEPRTVLITGACGNIGRKLREAWSDVYDLVLIDKNVDERDEHDEDVIQADLSVMDDDWITHFHGVDVVVHLAGNPDDRASWDDLIGPNIDATTNVFHAAALAGVERLVFASSNHVMGGHRDLGDGPITTAMEPRPDGPYAITKLIGERLGRSLALAFDLTFIALRLGWVQRGKNRRDTLPDDWSRKHWLSNGDLVRLFDAALEAEIEDRSALVVNGMSRNHGMRWDLSASAELLGYLPEDDAFSTAQASEHRE